MPLYADDTDTSCSSYWILGHGFPEEKMWGGGGEEEGGEQAEEEEGDAEKQKRVGGRETIKQEEEGSPRLHQVSYRSYSRSGTQMIIVRTFIFLQDLF